MQLYWCMFNYLLFPNVEFQLSYIAEFQNDCSIRVV